MSHAKGKIKYGNVELDDSYFDLKNHKARVTTFVDGDVLAWLRKESEKIGVGYQTLLNMKLRESMQGAQLDEAVLNAFKKLLSSGTIQFRPKAAAKGQSVKKRKTG